MKVVYKYNLGISSDLRIEMPSGAQILKVEHFNNQASLWALVDPENSTTTRRFNVVGTGMSFNADGMRYIGSIIDDIFIWHVFEVVHDPF